MQEKLDTELKRLEELHSIQPVQFAEWAAPVMPMIKPDKITCICKDYKLTVNQPIKLDKYPVLKIEDLYAKLARSQSNAKLDMNHTHQQLELYDTS